MSFFRIKKIKKQEYAYLVRNKWTKSGARQKVGKYMGKVIRLQKTKEPFDVDISSLSPKMIVDSLIQRELLTHGFQLKDELYILDDLRYQKTKLIKGDKPIVLFINDGYFCEYSIKKLYSFNYMGDESSTATQLANSFLDAGINVPSDVFISLFKMVYKPDSVTKFW